ncbi:MAG: hypothetical protein H0X38_14460 [Planctomycetes bacterium]|nr:hypothetical protein [Planctomycetota bacterium]
MAMTDAQRVYLNAHNILSQEKSKDKAAQVLKSRGMSEAQARALIDEVFRDNQAANRKTAFVKIGLSALSLVVFGAIFVFTGRVFFIILPLAAIGFLWGLIKALTADGFDIEAGGSDD